MEMEWSRYKVDFNQIFTIVLKIEKLKVKILVLDKHKIRGGYKWKIGKIKINFNFLRKFYEKQLISIENVSVSKMWVPLT